jgi:hypothetical protein
MSNLANILQSRAQDVIDSRTDTVLGNLNISFDYLNSELMLKAVFDELVKNLPDSKPLIDKIIQTRRINLPSSYKEKVQACISILLFWVKGNQEPFQLMSFFSHYTDSDIMTNEAMTFFFIPVYKYIAERIVKMWCVE